jgi:hypothetical protein
MPNRDSPQGCCSYKRLELRTCFSPSWLVLFHVGLMSLLWQPFNYKNIFSQLAPEYPVLICSKLGAYHTLVPSCRALAKFLVRSTLQFLICKWRWAVFCSMIPASCTNIIFVLTSENNRMEYVCHRLVDQFTSSCTHHKISSLQIFRRVSLERSTGCSR